MLRGLLIGVVALLVLVPTAGASTMTSPESSLLHQMNVVRAEHGLKPLSVDSRLEQAARFHSHEMLSNDVFEHGAFGTRMARFRIHGTLAGENLAWGTGSLGTAKAVVAAWLASPEHRANLLRPSFRRVGIGELTGSFEGYADARVVTADFAG
ncbi:MAG TPA: CAP domain-containing protein [Gaiellaceae bacterium]|nr:CAP domain-containing protein [Gaiellaceae bacterium]